MGNKVTLPKLGSDPCNYSLTRQLNHLSCRKKHRTPLILQKSPRRHLVGHFFGFFQKKLPAMISSKAGLTNSSWNCAVFCHSTGAFFADIFLDGARESVIYYILHQGCAALERQILFWRHGIKEMESWPGQFCGPVRLPVLLSLQ